MGYVSYESVRYFEPVQVQIGTMPDYEFGLFLDAVIFDRLQNKCEYITLGENRLDEIKETSREEFNNKELSFKEKNHHLSREKFENMVLETKEKLKPGKSSRVSFPMPVNMRLKGINCLFMKLSETSTHHHTCTI